MVTSIRPEGYRRPILGEQSRSRKPRSIRELYNDRRPARVPPKTWAEVFDAFFGLWANHLLDDGITALAKPSSREAA